MYGREGIQHFEQFQGKTVGKLNNSEQRRKKEKTLHSSLIVSHFEMIDI